MPIAEVYWSNPQKYAAATKAYRLAHLDWHRKTSRDRAAKKRATDPDFVARSKIAQKKYRDKNKKYLSERSAKWCLERPGIHLFYNAKRRAKKLGLPFNLTRIDVVIPATCPVLGIPIYSDRRGRRGFDPNSPSIDRLIPSKGYVRDNIRIISMRANAIKGDASLEELEAVAAYVRRETVR